MKSNNKTFEATTNGIHISALPHFLEEQSSSAKDVYIWTYTISIRNLNNYMVQLLARHWKIVDDLGQVSEVTGEGVVGNQPFLAPNESFEYTSSTYLKSPSGVMYGEYTFLNLERAEKFNANIPVFSLDSPFKAVTLI